MTTSFQETSHSLECLCVSGDAAHFYLFSTCTYIISTCNIVVHVYSSTCIIIIVHV